MKRIASAAGFLTVMLIVTSCTAFAPNSDVHVNCRVKEELAGRTNLSIEVVNAFSGAPPSMSIGMRRSGDPPLYQHVDKNTAEFDTLPVGRWEIDTRIPTSSHTVHGTVDLQENWSCRVRVLFLESKDVTAGGTMFQKEAGGRP
jgi:hypothetical protein